MMKPPKGKLPLPIIIIIMTCVIVLVTTLHAERLILLSSKFIFTFTNPSDTKADEVVINAPLIDGDRFNFDPEPVECNVANGKWVFNNSVKPLYSDTSCPYIDRQYSCVKNGRTDSYYHHWEWQPQDCTLPRFNPELALQKLQGKRLLFVGDSLQRNQWESFVCLVEWVIPREQKSMKSGRVHSVFKVMEYNATIEFYSAPYLVESNTDVDFIGDTKKRIIKVDAIAERATNWTGVDILVFNTYTWWASSNRIKTLRGSFANREEGYEDFDTPDAYELALKTWANWIDSTINPNKTRVFFTTMSPTHSRSQDWGNMEGVNCYNETRPVRKKKFWGNSDKRIMTVLTEVVKKMKVPVTFINITQISEYRVDGHPSVYKEIRGELLTEEGKANPQNSDCIHWCLPGVPDTWNQIFLALL